MVKFSNLRARFTIQNFHHFSPFFTIFHHCHPPVEELHRILPLKGWDNFKKSRDILYKLFPEFENADIWNEKHVGDLPVLSVKYFPDSEGAVAVDGSSSTGADVDGLFTSGPNINAKEAIKSDVSRQCSSLPAYNMDRRYKGICMIVNNEKYDKARKNQKRHGDRRGSSKDAESLQEMFKKLGFFVEYHKNLSKVKLDKLVDMMVKVKQLKDYSCFVAVFLLHGENEHLCCVDGQDKKIDDIINAFKGDNCPALNGIPKWFIIQACRGKGLNCEVSIDQDGLVNDGHDVVDDGHDVEQQSEKPICIPACADFYISYATAPGYYAYRSPVTGSWFIQCLCEILEKYKWFEDVNTMMTRVNKQVALGDYCHKMEGVFVRQMPYHVNMLTGSLYLGTARHRITHSEI